jgi:hypothetical protein
VGDGAAAGAALWAALHGMLGLPPPPADVPVDAIADVNYARFRASAVQV